MKQINFTLSLVLVFIILVNIDMNGQCNAPTGDICSEAVDFGLIETTPCHGGMRIIEEREGCLFGATTEPGLEGCSEFSTTGTVWFKAGYNADAYRLRATLKTEGAWHPRISVYKGNNCSDLFSIYDCSSEGALDHVADAVIDQFGDDTVGNTWIAISYDPTTVNSTSDLSFKLSIEYIPNCGPCNCGLVDSLEQGEVSVVQRSILPLSDTSGVFCPGEEVVLCLSFDVKYSQSSIAWVHGLIPRFGKGWDLANSDLEGARITPDTAKWVGWDDLEGCGATASYLFPCIRKYYDEYGELQFSSISLGHPAGSKSIEKGDTLPSGWFYRSPSQQCIQAGCSPSDYWGLPGSSQGSSMEICLDLKVKEDFGSYSCEENNALDIKLLSTSDEQTGCWNNQGTSCSAFYIFDFGKDWKIDCDYSPLDNSKDIDVTEMTIYPNPVQDNIYVKDMDQTAYEVLDMYGKKISLGQYNPESGIVTTDLSSGIYILRLQTAKGWSWGRFVKE